MTSLWQFWLWGQKWPKKAQNDRTWSEYLKSDIWNHLHWISASLAIILSGHMTSLRQVWVWGQNWLKNGQKWPKKAPNGQKWPERMENDFWNHRHWNSAPLAVVLSGHMTSLWQFFLRDPKWPKMAKNGQKWSKMAPKWPKMMWLSEKWLKLIYFTDLKHFWLLKDGCATFPQWGGLNGPKFWFCRREKFLMSGQAETFLISKLTLKPYFGAFSGNLKMMFLRKMHFCVRPFQPKKGIFGLLGDWIWPKNWKMECFQFIQSKI